MVLVVPKINWPRVVAGGLAAGVVVNLAEFIANGILLRDRWEKAMLELNRPLLSSPGEVAALQAWGLLIGISAVALYAHLIGRYGEGWRTACATGLWVWIVGYLSSAMTGTAMGVFPVSLTIDAVLAGLAGIMAACLTGAALYRPRK